MLKPNKIVDIVFLSILGIGVAVSIYTHLFSDFVLTLNNYAAFIFYITVIICKIIIPEKVRYAVLILLGLSVFDIINFTVEVINAKIFEIGSNWAINSLGFNVFIFLLFVVYCLFNKSLIFGVLKTVLSGSDKEIEEEKKKMINFYYDKFKNVDKSEFDNLYGNFKNYPEEAQIALDRLLKDKKEK
jgi:hypothetical protein